MGEKELVPCNCRECAASAAPWYHDYRFLLKLQRKGKPTVVCQHSAEDVPIANLMGGIEIMRPADEIEALKAEKRHYLEKKRIIEADAARQFQLDQQIADLEH